MEDTAGGEESVGQSPAGPVKSKLDTLSKDDLIKFAKKQIAGMQKMKSRCVDLEKEIEVLKQQPKSNNIGTDDSILQELTGRMDALLLEKAELQQSLVLSRKDLESNEQNAKEELAALQQELKHVIEDRQKKIETLESSIEEFTSKHQEEIAFLQNLLKEREDFDKQRENEREGERLAEQKSKDDLAALQHELDRVVQDHHGKIEMLESSINELNSKHQEEVAVLQNLLKEREEIYKQQQTERKAEHSAEVANAKETADELRRSLESQLDTLRVQLETIQERKTQEIVELQEEHQKKLTEAQQEMENLKEELAQMIMQHEEEMRALEEDSEIERDRLLSIQDQLTEQLALKDSYLQDVKEEDEEPALRSGIAKMLELSGCSQVDSVSGDGEETGRPRAALEELQAQNTMLQDELTLLTNVKAELEAELEQTKEEFQVEREELEFKINELHMARETLSQDNAITMETELQGNVPQHSKTGKDQEDNLQNKSSESALLLGDRNHLTIEEVGAQCEELTRQRDLALAECQHMREILQGVETELGEKTKDFIQQYNAMKEQSASTVQELQDNLNDFKQERDELLGRMKEITEEKNSLFADVQDLKIKLEMSAREDQKLQISVQEQTTLASELERSVKELTEKNEVILSQLKMKENMTQDLKDLVQTLTAERDQIQCQLQHIEEAMQRLKSEKDEEVRSLLEEKENEVRLIREEKETALQSLQNEEDEVLKVKQGKEKMEQLKAELDRGQETISALEQNVRDLSSGKTTLHQKLEEITFALSESQKSKEILGSQFSVLEAQLEQEISEKNQLESKVSSLKEEAEGACAAIKALEEKQSEALTLYKKNVDELQTRIDDLEKDRNILRNSLEEAQGVPTSEEAEKELQARILDLELERNMLRNNLEEVERDTSGLQGDLEHMKMVSERIVEENKNLQEEVSLQKEEKERETENVGKERKQLQDQLTEKEYLISQMKTEIAALQESATQSAASAEENVTSESTDNIALLEKELKIKDEKINKMKAVAIKAKKELEIRKKEVASLNEEVESLKTEREKMNSSVKDIITGAEGYKNLQIDYDRQTEQLDKEREKVESAERQIAELTKRLSSAVTQNETMSSEKEDLLAAIETARKTLRQLEAQIQDLQRQLNSLEKDLLAERAVKEQKMKDLSSATKEVEELTAQLCKQQQQSQQTAQELEQLRKEAQQNSLLDMEMADYERLVKELNTKLLETDEYVEQLKAQISTLTQREETLKKEIETLKLQQDQGEEKTSKIKQLLLKTKKDLADAKKQESSLLVQQASLKGELEGVHQQLESSKIEMCEMTADRHRLQEQLRSALDQHQRTSSSLQQCITGLQQEREAVKAELVATTAEYDSYKVRVHNVLKQQKSKSTTQADVDTGKMEREQLSAQVEQLRSRLTESQQSLHSTTAELQQLQTEHDTLLERHNKILQEAISKEAELRERVLSLQSENVTLQADLSETQADLSSRVETQRQTYREQLRKLQDDHRTTIETLQAQLTRVEEQLFNLQSQNMLVQSGRKSEFQRRNTDPSQAGLGLVPSDLQSVAREEGEGMETTEMESLSPAVTPLTSLEHLLMSPDPKQEPFVWNVEPTKEELTQKLNTATRSMEHMNSLLHETEATNAVLMEQITLLKSELRRLERNQEREKSVANLEYLKNVLLQFIFLRSGSERQALLPVIHTMLQLSPEEKSKLAAIAQGEEEGSGGRGSGWSSYLHSWSGIR